MEINVLGVTPSEQVIELKVPIPCCYAHSNIYFYFHLKIVVLLDNHSNT